MRGGLDETLARLARREEALRRRAAEPAGASDPTERPEPGPGRTETGRNAGPGWADPPVPRRTDGPDPGPRRADGRERGGGGVAGRERGGGVGSHRAADTAGRDPVEEVAEAVRRVVAGHPGLAVSVRVEQDGQAYPLRVAWSGPDVAVHAEPAPPPAWPLSVNTVPDLPSGRDGVRPDPAARLAELIRRDPTLLADGDPPR
ncbi:hypothetical protein GA0070609_5361 [Micromonospora echinaurantiaca]|uniref:Uncharacterized protein n=1 Tax=Micromonospora echinaurantiaca TaxID=47857 RepID=A0A1C5K4F4_9ACTN|nr:hypothetical protein [Micromonospora echinaurantiaca]SCG77256.1 hypothetical protein GA0070609_5361 [Micromonospora echinaurantiaca]